MSAETIDDPQPAGRVVPLIEGNSFRPTWPNPFSLNSGKVAFDRGELRQLLDLYGRKVANGEWRDYAIDFTSQKAVFSVYRRACEFPLYRIEKTPRLARRQGAYSVLEASGRVLRRSHELAPVLSVLDKRLTLVSS